MDTSASQNIVVYLRGDKDLKMEISQTTIFNFLSKKNIKMHCTDPQGSLYMDCPNQQHTRILANLGNIAHYIFDILMQFLQCVRHSRFFSLLACMLFVFHSIIFFFLWSDIVAMISIGKIHITVLGIFMVSLLSVDCFWIALAC